MATNGTAAPRTTPDYARIAAAAGLLLGVLVLISIIITFAGGAPPALDASAQKVINYYQDNEGLAKLGAVVGFLILGLAPIFYLGLYGRLRDRGAATGAATASSASDASWPRLGLVAFIAAGAVVAVQGSSALALALGAKDEFQGAPGVAGSLFDLYNALGAALAILFAVFLIATGVSLARSGGFPTWLTPLLYVGGVASLVSFLAPFTEVDAFAFIGIIPYICFGVLGAAGGASLRRGSA
jgi:hypothetical protein